MAPPPHGSPLFWPVRSPTCAACCCKRMMERINQLLEYALHIGSFHISVGALLGFVFTLILVWLAGHYLRRAFDRYAATRESTLRPAIYTVSRLTYYLFVVTGLLVALSLPGDRKSTRLNSSHYCASRLPSSA